MPICAQIRAGLRARARSRNRLLALAASVTALAAPAVAQGAANPLTFDYDNSYAITDYAKPTGAVVVGRNFFNPSLVDQIQSGGGEVYQYVDVIDGWWTTWNATGDQAALYGGAQQNPSWLMSPRRSNWPNTSMTDMRPGSPWIIHAVEHIKKWFPTTHAKGIFLDVVGERLWTGSWDGMSASEKANWTAGNRDFVHRLRVAMGPSVILVANNSWPSGNSELNGITIEHHSISQASNWSAQTGRADWFKPVRNLVIANSASEAGRWAAVPGVTHVSAQASYGAPARPLLPFSLLPGPVPSQDAHLPVAPPPALGPAPIVLPGPTQPAPKRRASMKPDPTPETPATAPAPSIPAQNLLANPSLERSGASWRTWHAALGVAPVADAPAGDRAARVRFSGVGTAYSLGHASRRVAVTTAGAALSARAYVRAGSRSAQGKPLSLYIRETNPRGRVVQRVRSTVRLGNRFAAVTATLIPRSTRNRVDMILVQRRAADGDAFLADALSIAG